jgi:hypothetical protein
MTPLGNINLNKIIEKIAHMSMKQKCGQAFQPIKGCYILTSINATNLMDKYPILHHMGKEKKQMCSIGFSLDHRSLKTGALNVEKSFTCRRLAKFWQEVVNLKNEVDKKKHLGCLVKNFIP